MADAKTPFDASIIIFITFCDFIIKQDLKARILGRFCLLRLIDG
ncbi:MAG: hypothetical protein PHP26_07490 [Syntrophomonas sp.]|nr:hypothetical protein [Syntrophomonas sp.]MDD2510074.1 hypothetical protein [Syntrophomonas sp.]MDD3879819.1 hypothetical protein [Syntrophomonas sp.]MDD4626786.1 hypothetical protein [Syntrophomonas sp.]